MDKNKTVHNFYVRNWTFFEIQKKIVLIDEKDNYISFVSDRFFREIASVLESCDIHNKVSLKELVELARINAR